MHEVEKGAGNRLGGYRLIRRLAVDANAEVHLAVPITGGDPVAIKVPSAAVSTAAMFAM